MDTQHLKTLLEKIQSGQTDLDTAFQQLKKCRLKI